MRKKRNTREAEVMAEKRDDKGRKRGEAGMEREREKGCCLSLILQSVQTSRSSRCARWLLRRFVWGFFFCGLNNSHRRFEVAAQIGAKYICM